MPSYLKYKYIFSSFRFQVESGVGSGIFFQLDPASGSVEKNVGSSLKKDLVKHEDVKFLYFSCLKKTHTFEALYGTQDSFFWLKVSY